MNHNYNKVDEIFKDLAIESDPNLRKILGEPAQYAQEFSLDAQRLARYELLQLWDIPNNPKNWTNTLPHWRVEHQRLVANQEKHTDYDQIKAERDKWTSLFAGLTPEQVKAKYDDLKKRLEFTTSSLKTLTKQKVVVDTSK